MRIGRATLQDIMWLEFCRGYNTNEISKRLKIPEPDVDCAVNREMQRQHEREQSP